MEQYKLTEEAEEIISELVKKRDRIIPIIGDNSFVGILEEKGENRTVPFQEYIVKIIGTELPEEDRNEISKSGYGYFGMDILCDKYCYKHSVSRKKFRKTVSSKIEKSLQSDKIKLKDDIKEFLLAGRFDVIITTNPFHILERQLEAVSLAYNMKSFVPRAVKMESRAEEKLKIPSIYQIFGASESEFVLTETNLLYFLHSLNADGYENGYGANSLIKYIKEKSGDGKGNCILMPIGCDNLPDWLFRFLWYPLSPDHLLLGNQDDYDGGVWYKYSCNKSFTKFLSEYHFQTLKEPLDLVTEKNDLFLSELSRRFRKQISDNRKIIESEMNVDWEDNEWDIFISYASEDRDIVLKIYDSLKRHGKKVWMDNRQVNAGEYYWQAIQYGIEHSKRCMLIISEAYLQKATRYVLSVNGQITKTGLSDEIPMIAQVFKDKLKDIKVVNSYSIPVILEGTKVQIEDKGDLNIGWKTVLLDGRLLEELYEYGKYTTLRTADFLFKGIQSVILNTNNIDEIIQSIN